MHHFHGFFSLFAIATVIVIAGTESVIGQSRVPSLNPILNIANTMNEANKIWAEVELAKQKLLQEALEMARQDKERAKQERSGIQRMIQEIEQKQVAREWAMTHVRLDQASSGSLSHVDLTKSMMQWKKARDRHYERYVLFPDESKGQIRSGKALNYMLDSCGSAAINLQVFSSAVIEEINQNELQLAMFLNELSRNDELPDDLRGKLRACTAESASGIALLVLSDTRIGVKTSQAIGQMHAELLASQEKEKLLQSVCGNNTLSSGYLKSLQFTRGGDRGKQVVVTLTGDVLPLNWPYLIQSDQRYSDARLTLMSAKEDGLNEIRRYGRLNHDTMKKLLDASDKIYHLFQREKLSLLHQDRGSQFKSKVFRASNFTKTLRSGVAYLVTANSADAVANFDFSEPATPVDLLAFVSRNGLRFAHGGKERQEDYVFVYKQILDLYANLNGLKDTLGDSVDRDDTSLRELRDENEALRKIEYQDVAEALKEGESFEGSVNRLWGLVSDAFKRPDAMESETN